MTPQHRPRWLSCRFIAAIKAMEQFPNVIERGFVAHAA
jgi:hypothetical protein